MNMEGVRAFNSSFIIPHSSFSLLHCHANRESGEGARRKVADEKPKLSNEISDGTGQFDARFVLWRRFCAENGIAVETLPSDLKGDAKDKWEKLKNEQLHKPAEEKK